MEDRSTDQYQALDPPKIVKEFPPGTAKDETFDCMAVQSNAWRGLPYNRKSQLLSWTLFWLMGVGTGIIAFGMDRLEDFLVGSRKDVAQSYLDAGESVGVAWLSYSLMSTAFVSIAVSISLYWGPGAIGSGVAETMGMVNGYNYHDFIGIPTLITKIFGVVLAVSGGMKVGKEGPLAHIGSLVGVCCMYLPGFTMFRNDRDKRAIIAAGAGVGVSVAFGAPIGGVLFAYEVSKANSFWTFNLAWKTFLATSMANFTLTFMDALVNLNFENVTNAGLIKFGDISDNSYNMADVVVFCFIGILGGLLGALFVEINMFLARKRKQLLKSKAMKFFEALAFAFVGSTIVFFLPSLFPCMDLHENLDIGVRYQCSEDQVNEMGTLFFNTEGDTIKYLLKANASINVWVAMTFMLVWFFFTSTTYGCAIPAGLFFPGLLIGASLGQFVGRALIEIGILTLDDN
jgi:chloride channel 7